MAIGDIVAPRLAKTFPSTFQAQPPRWAIVVNEVGGPPLLTTVLSDQGQLSVIEADNAAGLFLDIISDPGAANIAAFVGQVALRIAPAGASAADPAGGTSREFAGEVVSVHRRTPFESLAPGTGPDFVLIRVSDTGTYYEDLATNFTVLGNR